MKSYRTDWRHWFKIFFVVLSFLLLVTYYFDLSTKMAENKPLWADETVSSEEVCRQSLQSLLKNGASIQISRGPLYYLLQRANNLRSTKIENIYLHSRLVSLVAFLLLCSGLYWFLFFYLGYPAALLACISLGAHPILIQYAAEDRPYMLWVFLVFALFAVTFVWMRRARVLFAGFYQIFAGLLAVVASPGMIQVAFAGLAFLVFRFKEKILTKKQLLLCSTFTMVAILVGFFYAIKTFDWSGQRMTYSQYDLLAFLARGDYSLIKGLIRLVWPKGNFLVFLLNGIFFLGVVGPFLFRSKIAKNKPYSQLAFAFGFLLLATALIGALIVYNRMYFIQRNFIFLRIIYAVFCGIGMGVLWDLLHRFFGQKQWLMTALATLSILFAIGLGNNSYSYIEPVEWIRKSPIACKNLKGNVYLMYGHWVTGPPTAMEVFQFVQRVSLSVKRCQEQKGVPNYSESNNQESKIATYVEMVHHKKPEGWVKFHYLPEFDNNSIIPKIRICGQPVIYTDKNFCKSLW